MSKNKKFFSFDIPDDKIRELQEKYARERSYLLLEHIGKNNYLFDIPGNCTEFLKVKGKAGRNTDLFGDYTCRIIRRKNKPLAFFHKTKARDINEFMSFVFVDKNNQNIKQKVFGYIKDFQKAMYQYDQ